MHPTYSAPSAEFERPPVPAAGGPRSASDAFWETVLALLKHEPLLLLRMPWWMLKGGSYCERQVMRRAWKPSGRPQLTLTRPDDFLTPPVAAASERRVRAPGEKLIALIRAARVHQWVKNLLLFIPLLLAHRAMQPALLLQNALAFFAFGLCASSVYVLNDLLDLTADRQHPWKRHRPFAAGILSVRTGLLLFPLLLGGGLGVAVMGLPPAFAAVLALYFVVSTAYSFYLKRLPLIDVFVLAGLYTVRILAGGLAVGVAISPWLFAFSMFLFTSLAFLKRYAELTLVQQLAGGGARGRDYLVGDMALLRSLGSSAGFLSVLVLALYVNSTEVTVLYTRPTLLWLIGPLLLYWISRMWLFAHRGQMQDDPVVFTIKDPASYVLGTAVAVIVAWAAL